MPVAALSSTHSIELFTSPNDVPDIVMEALENSGVNANVILPTLLKARSDERSGKRVTGHLWIVLYSSGPQRTVEYILSCTKGYMGEYPIFIFTTKPYDALHEDVVFPAIESLARALKKSAELQRVYSVFAVDRIAIAFADVWTTLTGIESYTNPYYDSTISFCSRQTMRPIRQMTSLPGIQYKLDIATPADIPEIAKLCEMFAAESEPFVLTPSQSRREAEILVENRQVWVHRISRDNGPTEIASIVAYTRNDERVASITKVFTNPRWRRLGCAERLVRRVCKQLLNSTDAKEWVALFVGNDNPAANVYARVGFVGLDKKGPRVEGVDRWLEIGFDRTVVRQGHW